MKLFLLMVLFSTPNEPEPHDAAPYGFGSRPAKDLHQCMARREHLLGYLEENVPPQVKFTAFCVEITMNGYVEGLENFKRSIGEPS